MDPPALLNMLQTPSPAPTSADQIARAALSVLTDAEGGPVRLVSVARKAVEGSSGDFKSFWTIIAAGRDGQARYFVKASARRLHQSDFNRLLNDRHDALPRFMGAHEPDHLDGPFVYVWRHVDGHARRGFSGHTLGEIERIVRTLAQIEQATLPIVPATSIRRGLQWVGPLMPALREFGPEIVEAGGLPLLKRYKRREAAVLEWLADRPDEILVHNDVKAPNVLVAGDGRLTLVDWDSASIGPRGASLRCFSRRRKGVAIEDLVVDSYVDELAHLGVAVDRDDIMLTMRAQEVFWSLATGVKHRNVRRILTGLRQANRAFRPFDAKARARAEAALKDTPA